jgi:hypothetical protein
MKNETKTKSKLTQEIKDIYDSCVCYTLENEKYRYEKIHTLFEISIAFLDDVDGWDYEDELGKIFDDILEAKNRFQILNPHYRKEVA